MCGGTLEYISVNYPVHGLSPRVRGNPDEKNSIVRVMRSIPACAGEPADSGPACATKRVYPRVCGGTTAGHPVPGTSRGLSPRVRGNLRHERRFFFRLGSIPACAGEPKLPHE